MPQPDAASGRTKVVCFGAPEAAEATERLKAVPNLAARVSRIDHVDRWSTLFLDACFRLSPPAEAIIESERRSMTIFRHCRSLQLPDIIALV
jgi:hypothetical protein